MEPPEEWWLADLCSPNSTLPDSARTHTHMHKHAMTGLLKKYTCSYEINRQINQKLVKKTNRKWSTGRRLWDYCLFPCLQQSMLLKFEVHLHWLKRGKLSGRSMQHDTQGDRMHRAPVNRPALGYKYWLSARQQPPKTSPPFSGSLYVDIWPCL